MRYIILRLRLHCEYSVTAPVTFALNMLVHRAYECVRVRRDAPYRSKEKRASGLLKRVGQHRPKDDAVFSYSPVCSRCFDPRHGGKSHQRPVQCKCVAAGRKRCQGLLE